MQLFRLVRAPSKQITCKGRKSRNRLFWGTGFFGAPVRAPLQFNVLLNIPLDLRNQCTVCPWGGEKSGVDLYILAKYSDQITFNESEIVYAASDLNAALQRSCALVSRVFALLGLQIMEALGSPHASCVTGVPAPCIASAPWPCSITWCLDPMAATQASEI